MASRRWKNNERVKGATVIGVEPKAFLIKKMEKFGLFFPTFGFQEEIKYINSTPECSHLFEPHDHLPLVASKYVNEAYTTRTAHRSLGNIIHRICTRKRLCFI